MDNAGTLRYILSSKAYSTPTLAIFQPAMNIALIIMEPNVISNPATIGAATIVNWSIARIFELSSVTERHHKRTFNLNGADDKVKFSVLYGYPN